jgi:hypothetical protein
MLNFIRIFRGSKCSPGGHSITPACRTLRLIASTTSVGLIATATCLGQEPAQQIQPATTITTAASHPTLDLRAYLNSPFNPADESSSPSSSSISGAAEADENAITDRLSHLALASDSNQPPPRRTYGKPHYADSSHNADGSNKWGFQVGGGFTLPIGGTHAYLTTSYDFQAAGGRNFSNKFRVFAEFDWHNFGFQTATLNNLLATYNKEILQYNLSNPGANIPLLTALGGTSHVWSFTVDPAYTFLQHEKFGSYVRGGVGFYHKTANFYTPSIGYYCDPYYGCYQYAANQTIDKYTSNAVGFEGGFGFTYRPSRFAGESFYAEGRYVFMNNSARPYSEGSSTSNYYNVFPQNSAKTTFIPVTFGLRF